MESIKITKNSTEVNENITEEDLKAIKRLLDLTGDEYMTLEEFRRIQRGEFK